MEPVCKSVFSTERLSAPVRYDTWRESISAIFEVAPLSRTDLDCFDASLTSYLLNDQVMLSHCQTKAQSFERSSRRTVQDGLDHYVIQTHLSGSQEVRRGCNRFQAEPGDLLVIDLADRHAAVTSDFDHLSLVVPRHLLAPILTHPDSQEGRVIKAGDPLVAVAVDQIKTLAGMAGRLTRTLSAQLIPQALTLMGAVLNGTPEGIENARQSVAASFLMRAMLAIECRLSDNNLSVATICREVGLSRASLYRLFRPCGGVRAYVQEQRLRRSVDSLFDPCNANRPIYEIAFDWGFVSEAHFSRAFKARFGVSPRDARQMGLAAIGEEDTGASMLSVGDRHYEYWLAETLKCDLNKFSIEDAEFPLP